MDARDPEPTQELRGRDSLAPVFDNLNSYVATMHFNGQSTISLDGDQATGQSYCLAHHLKGTEDRGAHADGRVDPVSRSVHQAGRPVALCRAAADGQLDRYPTV
jgi:hypothetical protein